MHHNSIIVYKQELSDHMEPATQLVVLVSIHFMILFTAFNAFQNIVTRINENQGDYSLGPFRFALNYFAFLIANLFAPSFKYSEKWQITISTLTYTFHYLTGFFVSGSQTHVKFIMAALGAIVNGIGASFLWTSVGSYIHKVCHLYNKVPQKGHYYGLFNTIFCLSTILGAIVVTFGLSMFSYNVYFSIVSGVSFLAFIFGIFFIKDLKLPEQHAEPQQKLSVAKFAKNAAISTLKFYPIMKYSLGLIILDGTNIGVVTSTMLHLTPKLDDKKQNNLNAGFCLIFYGLGCVIGGFLGGKLTDRLRIRVSSVGALMVYSIVCLFSIAAAEILQMWSALIACFLWGFALYYITAILMVICSRLYGGRPESFAVVKQFHCFSFVIYEVVAMSTSNSIPVLYLMIALFLLGIPALWGVCRSPDQNKKQIEQTIDTEQIEQSERETINTGQATKQSLLSQHK